MRSFAAFVAHVLFQAMRLGRVRRGLLTAYTVCVSTLALVLAMRGGQVSANGTFITANGTTANEWQVAGPAGPGLYEGDAGGIIVELEGGANPIADFGDTPSTMTLEPNVSLAGAAGTGALSFGTMTGATVMPTGKLEWLGASGAGKVLELEANSATGAIVENKGGFLNIDSSSTLTLGGTVLSGGGSVAIASNGGNVAIGAGGGAAGTLTMGYTGSGEPLLQVASGLAGVTNGPFVTIGPNLIPNNSDGTLTCLTGGTVTPSSGAFGVIVTTGTLSSNCIIDFGANNTSGIFLVDLSGATISASFGIQFKNGSATLTYLSSGVIAGTLATVWTHGANTLAVSY